MIRIRPMFAAGVIAMTALGACKTIDASRSTDVPLSTTDMWRGPAPWLGTRDDTVKPWSKWVGAKYRLDPTSCPTQPPVEDEERAVTVGVYEGLSLSSAAVGGLDQTTRFITVRIEPGATPIYLTLISSESIVWRLVGATDRVTQAVVSSKETAPNGAPAVGIIGLPTERIFFASPVCPGFFDKPDAAANILNGDWPARSSPQPWQRNIPNVIAAETPLSISVPSGKTVGRIQTATMPDGFDPAMWGKAAGNLRGRWPGGVVLVPTRKVVSQATVQSYRVLPGLMGIAQLVGSGAITALETGAFRIIKPIPSLPNGSFGFFLAPGVPVPAGSVGHSCLTIEQTGERRGVCTIGG